MQSKQLALIAASVAAALIGGCANKPSGQLEPISECTFPDSPKDAAPLWVCDAPVDGVPVSAIGSHEKSAAGVAFTRDQATALARVRLAQNMRTHVQNMIKQFAETTGSGKTETVDRVNTSVSKLITNESIEGSKVFRTATSPNGTMYVLVGLDQVTAEQSAKAALKTSMRNDRATWQQFNASKAQDELANEIAKQRVSD
jgi:hypothetical protein